MGFRDILAQLMAGGGGGGQPPSFDELLRRYQGDRDQAAKQFNAQQGGPISSAYSPPAAAAPDPMTTGGIPVPTPRPDVQQAPVPIPQPRPDFPPDLAVSPRHEPDRMAASAPTSATLPPVPMPEQPVVLPPTAPRPQSRPKKKSQYTVQR